MVPFADLDVGQRLGPIELTISRAANERYWRSAGVDHPALQDGALYPPMAANLTILLFQTVCDQPMLQTTQRLLCHRRAEADTTLTVSGMIADRFEKRGREYAVVQAVVALPDGELLWTSIVTFTEAGA